jgi:hypothetical protein
MRKPHKRYKALYRRWEFLLQAAKPLIGIQDRYCKSAYEEDRQNGNGCS